MQARRLPARQGLVWIIAGYRLFRANPPLLALLGFAYLLSATLALALPMGIGRLIFMLLQPMLTLVIANGCRAVAQHGRQLRQPKLVAGIRERRAELLRFGALQMAALLLCATLVIVVLGSLLGIAPDPAKPEEIMPLVFASVVVSLPVMMATWFAPLLIGWHTIPPLKAAFFSLVATLRNWRAFLVYGLLLGAGFGAALLAVFAAQQISDGVAQAVTMLVEFLMLFAAPIVISTVYISYRDIFFVPPAANE